MRIKTLAQNLILVAASSAVAYLIVEVALFRYLLPSLPLQAQSLLHPGVRVLAQSSKAGTVPHDYIAIVGDSYAQGFGDWLLDSDWSRNSEFNSANVIHDRTGRDVISFGAGGAGSLRGLVTEPITQYEFINNSYLYDLEKPKVIVVYFYAGNDFDDNIKDIDLRYRPHFDVNRIYDSGYFGQFIRSVVVGDSPLHQALAGVRPGDRLLLANFVVHSFENLFEKQVTAGGITVTDTKKWPPGRINRAVIGGNIVAIPDGLQAPGLELTGAELQLATYVFDKSLIYMSDNFTDSTIILVYVPSPLEVYQLESPTVSVQSYHERQSKFPSWNISINSKELCTRIRTIATQHAMGFVDARPRLREAASSQSIHGPRDWSHLNRKGYGILGDLVATAIADGKPVSDCD